MPALKLYTMDNCPWCNMLKKRLTHEGIAFVENKNTVEILSRDFKTVPQLEIEPDVFVDFEGAIKWLNSRA